MLTAQGVQMNSKESISEAFVDAMVEAQEVVFELCMYNSETGFDELVKIPFKTYQITKLDHLFDSMAAKHIDITEEMVLLCLSQYNSIGARKIHEITKEIK